jgi:hypothetical protein
MMTNLPSKYDRKGYYRYLVAQYYSYAQDGFDGFVVIRERTRMRSIKGVQFFTKVMGHFETLEEATALVEKLAS